MKYKTKLLKLNISKEEVDKIISSFPVEQDLILAVHNKQRISDLDSVQDILTAAYKGADLPEDCISLSCMQPGMIVKRAYNPHIELEFKDKPIMVKREIAEYLMKQSPDKFKIKGE